MFTIIENDSRMNNSKNSFFKIIKTKMIFKLHLGNIKNVGFVIRHLVQTCKYINIDLCDNSPN